MIQDIADPEWVSGRALDAAFHAMIQCNMVFDALVKPAHLDALRLRLMRHPQLRAVLDHAGKPNIEQGQFDTWARDIERLALDTPVFCKLSGILTEAGARTSFEDLEPYIAHLFSCFGAERILWGSDWPVLDLASGYTEWLALARRLVGRLAPHGEQAVFARTAASVYALD